MSREEGVSVLRYPVAFAPTTVTVGALFIPEAKDRDIFADDGTEAATP